MSGELSKQAGQTSSPALDSRPIDKPSLDNQLRAILGDVLGLGAQQLAEFDADTGLFGHLPELDSMAVAGLLTEMEDRLDITIEDDDIDAQMLESYGGLLDFTLEKVAEASL